MKDNYFITPPNEEVRRALCDFFVENEFKFNPRELITYSLSHSKYIAVIVADRRIITASWQGWEYGSRENVNEDAGIDFYINLVKQVQGPNFPVKLNGQVIS